MEFGKWLWRYGGLEKDVAWLCKMEVGKWRRGDHH
jgi:hypothetical protein